MEEPIKQPENHNEAVAVETLEQKFVRELKEFESNDFKFKDGAKVFELGSPSQCLLNAGIPNIPIVITQSVINKAIGNDKKKNDVSHQIPIRRLESLIHQIQNPIVIIDSITTSHAKLLLTEIKDTKGETAVVAIHINNMLPGKRKVNRIASIHTRTEKGLVDLLVIAETKGELMYADRNKLKNWLNRVGKPQLLPKLLSQL